jgi:uncharacterized lipoprotein YehR (DUF1307 family)
MLVLKRVLAALFAVTLVFAAPACGDDAGEDRIGDGEINDEGD